MHNSISACWLECIGSRLLTCTNAAGARDESERLSGALHTLPLSRREGLRKTSAQYRWNAQSFSSHRLRVKWGEFGCSSQLRTRRFCVMDKVVDASLKRERTDWSSVTTMMMMKAQLRGWPDLCLIAYINPIQQEKVNKTRPDSGPSNTLNRTRAPGLWSENKH